jgi:hypothetical protein
MSCGMGSVLNHIAVVRGGDGSSTPPSSWPSTVELAFKPARRLHDQHGGPSLDDATGVLGPCGATTTRDAQSRGVTCVTTRVTLMCDPSFKDKDAEAGVKATKVTVYPAQ